MAGAPAMRGMAAAIAAVPFMYANTAFAEKSLSDAFPFFSSTPSSSAAPPPAPPAAAAPSVPAQKEETKPRNDNPRTTAAGFDPEALERGAKALREINNSPNSKKVFELMKKQEETRQTEEAARRSQYEVLRAQQETERQKVLHEEQRKTMQQQAQNKAQLARYEDELARKRMQAEHEAQRQRNAELVEMQEKSSVRQETLKRQTEEQILSQRLHSEREKAQIERETIRTRAMAEAEGRAHEARLAEDVNRRLLLDRANTEKEKWLAAINSTFEHIGGGLRALLTDQNKLVVAVGGVTALAAGIYTTREGARVMWRHIDRILGQPSLIRESSRGKYPWSRWTTQLSGTLIGKGAGELIKRGRGFGGVVLHPSLHKRIQQLAAATANTKKHDAPFRNMLFYGPPGTGKTMAAKELSKQSGLDYALMTGGDVAPLGPQAVTKIHEMFDWAGKTRKGLLLFIDEADAFLCQRNNNRMTEAQRSALNALLYRTGDQSRDIVLVLATNRPNDLDSAVTDRIDEVLEFPLPGEEERVKLLKLYVQKYIAEAGTKGGGWKHLFRKKQATIEIRGVTDDLIQEAARKTQGFSGREIAKLMASMQGAVYGSKESLLDANLFREVVDYKVAEHQQRRLIAGDTQPTEAVNSATGG